MRNQLEKRKRALQNTYVVQSFDPVLVVIAICHGDAPFAKFVNEHMYRKVASIGCVEIQDMVQNRLVQNEM